MPPLHLMVVKNLLAVIMNACILHIHDPLRGCDSLDYLQMTLMRLQGLKFVMMAADYATKLLEGVTILHQAGYTV